MDVLLVKKCNDYLHEAFGDGFNGMPNYQVLWSTGVCEKRLGTFRDFYGHILVREVTEVRSVLKYPYDQDRWILERLENAARNPELVDSYTYEPIYVFKDKHGLFLPLNFKVIEILTHRIKHPDTPSEIHERYAKEIEDEETKEVEDFLAVLHDAGRSPMFAYEDSVFLDSRKRKVE
jgi:hypothetical protein